MKGKTGLVFHKACMYVMNVNRRNDIAAYKKAASNLSVQAYKDFAN